MRLGWMSVPTELVDPLREQKSAADSGSPALDQLALTRLLRLGDYERHVLQARRAYRRRRDRLVRAITTRLSGVELRGAAAGMQLLFTLPSHVDDHELVEEASRHGINITALSRLHLTPHSDRGLLLGYGRLPEPSIEPAVEALVSALVPRFRKWNPVKSPGNAAPHRVLR
jgi:GntR family transcriptional regulator / MocR family aminotransferase